MIYFGIAGLLIISYAVWVKKEKKQDILFIIGGLFLLAYSIHLGDVIFAALQIVFIVSALIELIKLAKN